MKKSDLRPGMRVKLRNGFVYIYCIMYDDRLLIRKEGFINLNAYLESLMHDTSRDFDIMEVYGLPDSFNTEYFLYISRFCIWKREEEITLTLQEIADKFNIPVESLRIKE